MKKFILLLIIPFLALCQSQSLGYVFITDDNNPKTVALSTVDILTYEINPLYTYPAFYSGDNGYIPTIYVANTGYVNAPIWWDSWIKSDCEYIYYTANLYNNPPTDVYDDAIDIGLVRINISTGIFDFFSFNTELFLEPYNASGDDVSGSFESLTLGAVAFFENFYDFDDQGNIYFMTNEHYEDPYEWPIKTKIYKLNTQLNTTNLIYEIAHTSSFESFTDHFFIPTTLNYSDNKIYFSGIGTYGAIENPIFSYGFKKLDLDNNSETEFADFFQIINSSYSYSSSEDMFDYPAIYRSLGSNFKKETKEYYFVNIFNNDSSDVSQNVFLSSIGAESYNFYTHYSLFYPNELDIDGDFLPPLYNPNNNNICISASDKNDTEEIYYTFSSSGNILNYNTNFFLTENSVFNQPEKLIYSMPFIPYCQNESVLPTNYENKSLISIIDILGRKTASKGFQLHIYDDGSIEKKYVIE